LKFQNPKNRVLGDYCLKKGVKMEHGFSGFFNRGMERRLRGLGGLFMMEMEHKLDGFDKWARRKGTEKWNADYADWAD
jgi:hypothetical protein